MTVGGLIYIAKTSPKFVFYRMKCPANPSDLELYVMNFLMSLNWDLIRSFMSAIVVWNNLLLFFFILLSYLLFYILIELLVIIKVSLWMVMNCKNTWRTKFTCDWKYLFTRNFRITLITKRITRSLYMMLEKNKDRYLVKY